MKLNDISIITISVLVAASLSLNITGAFANDLKKKIIENAVDESMPLTPAQIEQIKRIQEERQEAITGRPAKIRVRTITLNIQPGMTPEKIITLPGYATSLSFFDQTGATWPVKVAKPGNPSAFHIEESKEKGKKPTNIITFSCVSENGHSNLTIQLEGMDMPLVFPLKIAATYKKTPTIDGIVAVRVNGFGPNAKPPVVEPRPKDPVSDDMVSYLDGISPKDAEIAELDPPNKDVTAWRQGKQLYLRTSNPILWPAWIAAVRGPADTRVYELPQVSSILLSCDGQIKRYTIKSKTHK
jgi:intracellular multiplication protein IcmK